MKTFYWHDYETWGATPSVDRPSQFAGVRTDEDLNIIDEPLVVYCQPPEDMWPHPEACLVTGITPQEAQAKGLSEHAFIARIHQELAVPGTCGVGYNTLRFDDEVTRYTLYRNFFDPYEREWRYGNSRWDIIDMVRLVYALRPEGIEWPFVDGKPSFKLENLSVANGLSHESAHDAYSDVEATIQLAKLIKERKPALYEYVVKNRSKHACAKMIDVANCKPLFHISSKFPSTRGCAGLIAPICMHPINKNAVIAYDLTVDPMPIQHLSADALRERIFTSQDALPEGVQRLPIKTIHLNKCPILGPTKLLDQEAASRLGIDREACENHWRILRTMIQVGAHDGPREKLQQIFSEQNFESDNDPETMLYNGFIGDDDKRLMNELRGLPKSALADRNFVFNDDRLNELFVRYKARNCFDLLSTSEQLHWREFVGERLRDGGGNRLSFSQLLLRIEELKIENADASERIKVLVALSDYATSHMGMYSTESA